MSANNRVEQGARLAAARKAAGFRSETAAATKFGWAYASYRAHETGFRTIGIDDAERYAAAYRKRGVEITAQQILFGTAQFVETTLQVKTADELQTSEREQLEIRAWRLIHNRGTDELRRIIATIEVAFPQIERDEQ